MKTLTLSASRGVIGRFQLDPLLPGSCLSCSRVAWNASCFLAPLQVGSSRVTTKASGANPERGTEINALGGSPANQVPQFATRAFGEIRRDCRIGRSLNMVTGATS